MVHSSHRGVNGCGALLRHPMATHARLHLHGSLHGTDRHSGQRQTSRHIWHQSRSFPTGMQPHNFKLGQKSLITTFFGLCKVHATYDGKVSETIQSLQKEAMIETAKNSFFTAYSNMQEMSEASDRLIFKVHSTKSKTFPQNSKVEPFYLRGQFSLKTPHFSVQHCINGTSMFSKNFL